MRIRSEENKVTVENDSNKKITIRYVDKAVIFGGEGRLVLQDAGINEDYALCVVIEDRDAIDEFFFMMDKMKEKWLAERNPVMRKTIRLRASGLRLIGDIEHARRWAGLLAEPDDFYESFFWGEIATSGYKIEFGRRALASGDELHKDSLTIPRVFELAKESGIEFVWDRGD